MCGDVTVLGEIEQVDRLSDTSEGACRTDCDCDCDCSLSAGETKGSSCVEPLTAVAFVCANGCSTGGSDRGCTLCDRDGAG